MKKKHLPTKQKTVLCLRTVTKDYKAYNDFIWPKLGYVEAPDWDPIATCGYGLHGYLKGAGNAESIVWSGLFQVVKVLEKEIVQLDGKVKFPRCEVIFTGSQKEATDILSAKYPNEPIIGVTVTGGYCSTVTGGDRSTVTGGDRSTVTGGDRSTVTGGYNSTVTGGYNSTVTGGYSSTVTGGDRSTVTGGNYSTVTGGDSSTVTGRDCSTVTGGYLSTVTGGNYSTVTGGYNSTVTGGNYSTVTGGYLSTLILLWWDFTANRSRAEVAYVGENGIKADVAYKLNDNKFEEVKK